MRPALVLLVGVMVLALAACGDSSSEASSEGPSEIVVTDPVMAEPTGTMAAVYLTLSNAGGADDRLVSARADGSEMVMLHRTTIDDDGLAAMEEAGPLTIPAGGEAVLRPGGDHLMLDVPAGLAVGDAYELTLVFEDHADITVDVDVVAREDLPRMIARRRRAVVAVLLAVAALVVAGCVDPPQDFDRAGAEEYGLQGSLIGKPLEKPDVVFTDTDGQPYDLRAETAGELTLVFFGYTSCPDVCPIHLGTIASAFQKIRLEGGVPNMVFVGVDTARDTPEKLREYLDRFDTRFVGLTATPEEIDRAMASLLLPAAVIDPEGEGGDDYLVGHPSQIVVFTPDDEAHVLYPFGATEQMWVEDLPVLETIDWGEAA